MTENYYMNNMQKLLHMVKVLHRRGFEKLRIVPSLAPSGLSWRCCFFVDTCSDERKVFASNWIQKRFDVMSAMYETAEELADLFHRDHLDFMETCRGLDPTYVRWFTEMLSRLTLGDLPYAYDDYFQPCDYWKTTSEREIMTLPDEKLRYERC